MNTRFKLLPLLFVTFFLFFSSPAWTSTPEPPARPSNYVVDLAGVIKDDVERSLNSYLRELDKKTSAQMVILTINSLDGEDIEGFSLGVAEKWKLGQKDKDNGALLVVSVKDRKYRFEVGYGLEGLMPDGFVGTVGRQYLVPYFRKSDYSTGIFVAASTLIAEIADNEGVKIEGTGSQGGVQRGVRKKAGPLQWFFGIVVAIFAIILFIKNPRLFILLLLMSGGRRGGWAGGGGFGGGGGGFGGGGGGGFGGGGASGGW